MIPERNKRVSKAILRVLGKIFLDEMYNHTIKDNVEISEVDVSKDLRVAKILYRAPEEKGKIIREELNKVKPFIRKRVAEEINLKYCPDIIFVFDRLGMRADKVVGLLDSLKKEEKNTGDDDQ